MKRISAQLILFFLSSLVLPIIAACSAEASAPETPTPTRPVIITATLPPTQTPLPSPTPVPATATAPVTPVEGQTSSQLNVRSMPSVNGEMLGTVNIFATVQIVGKDPTDSWWMIVYPESPTGTGWITAQFVQVTDTSGIPVIGTQPQATESAPTIEPALEGEAGPTVEAGSVETSTPAPVPVLATAYPDGDSIQAPAVSIMLSKASVRTFNYSSDLSYPEGDAEDWIQFLPEGQTGQQTIISVALDCSGSSPINIELIQNNVLLQSWDAITCGQRSQLELYLFAGAPYLLHLSPGQGGGALNYVAYTVIVSIEK